MGVTFCGTYKEKRRSSKKKGVNFVQKMHMQNKICNNFLENTFFYKSQFKKHKTYFVDMTKNVSLFISWINIKRVSLESSSLTNTFSPSSTSLSKRALGQVTRQWFGQIQLIKFNQSLDCGKISRSTFQAKYILVKNLFLKKKKKCEINLKNCKTNITFYLQNLEM